MTVEPPSADELLYVSDPDALLPGEDVSSTFLEDAVHWVRVYSELLELKLGLLARADQILEGVSDDAMREADIDNRLMRAEAARYGARHHYWTTRVEQLAAAPSRGHSGVTTGDSRG